jgi:hypothetical protein
VRAQSALSVKHTPRATSAAISAGDLMTRLYILADDSTLGRQAGTEGNLKGTAYIAEQARRIGLVPAGDSGSYFQYVPLVHRTFSEQSSLGVDAAQVIYGGDYTDSTTWISAEQAAGV